MTLANTARTYGGITKAFHWMTVLLIFTVIPLGIIARDLPYETSEQLVHKATLFTLHKSIGIAIFFVALARIIWAITQPRPGLLNAGNRPEATLAATIHWLLYGSLLLVPLAGWIHHAASTGFAPIWWPFSQSLPFVPKNETLAAIFAGLHKVLGRVLAISILLHIAGALKHHFIDKDATLRRMLPFSGDMPAPPRQHSSALPFAAALFVWGVALGIGVATGVYSQKYTVADTIELEAAPSQWVVQDGAIDISVTQFGSVVTGSFADWAAAITFDEKMADESSGTVDVTVAIATLSMGSVTGQALGFDFFDATAFPTARFAADILPIPDGYMAQGTLTIKGRTFPVDLHFDLYITGGVAQMKGNLFLDRRDFGIGDNMPDESAIGFQVEVDISLTAIKTPEQ